MVASRVSGDMPPISMTINLLLNLSAVGQIELNIDAGLFFEADRQFLVPFISSYVILAQMNNGSPRPARRILRQKPARTA